MEHPQQQYQQRPKEGGRGNGCDDSETPRRGMGVVRRRRHHVEPSFEDDDDGFGERNSWNDRRSAGDDPRDEEEGRFFRGAAARGGGGRSFSRIGSRKGGGGKDSSRRPALMFLAQAALSFVGMVVLPTQLAYEVLVRPPTPSGGGRNHRGSPISLGVGGESSRETAAAARGLFTKGGGGGRHGRRQLGDSGMVWVDRGSTASVAGEGEGASYEKIGRVLQTADEEEGESFTYSTRTQFHLCSASALAEADLRASVMDVFGVEQSQVCV